VESRSWNGYRGAVAWGNGATGSSGIVSEDNSLVGSNPGDGVGDNDNGFPSIVPLRNGNYVVLSPYWNGGRGAVTLGSGTAGISGIGSAVNSLVGSTPGNFATTPPADHVRYTHTL